MASYGASKVSAEFRDGVKYSEPILGRKYTVTHSDDTTELFVTIGKKYAKDKFGPLRDQVLLEFKCCCGKLILKGRVELDLPGGGITTKQRSDIFMREMNVALSGIKTADRELFKTCSSLNKCPILIDFRSKDSGYHRELCFGTMSDYKEI